MQLRRHIPTVDEEPPDPAASERALWMAVALRAYRDVTGISGNLAYGQEVNISSVDQRAARNWFRQRSMEYSGWGWVVQQLRLSPTTIRIIEKEVRLGSNRSPNDYDFTSRKSHDNHPFAAKKKRVMR